MATCLTPVEMEGLSANSLSPPDKARAEAHLAECEKCREELYENRGQDHLFKDLQQAYAENTTVIDERDAEPQSIASINDAIEGYEILSEIHRGGQGVVYKAVQQTTKRTVALKVLLEGPYASAKQRRRFEREIDLVAGLQHPNIVTVYDSGVTRDNRHYFAMEYVHGRPLGDFLSDTSLSIDETLRLFRKICTAVSYAHLHGVIHRDLKPGNICIDGEGEPHVLDFGLATAAGPDLLGGAPVSDTGKFMGTLAYASPEQTKGDPQLIDTRTDVYSLGVVLYEMLTGTFPYEVAGEPVEVYINIAKAEPKKPSTVRRQINDEVETIILKALSKERERRYQSAEAFARDIEHYLCGEPIDAKRDSPWYMVRKLLRRYRVAAGVALAFVLLLAVSTIAFWSLYTEGSQHLEEFQAVTVFQQSMLGRIGAAKMTRGIIDEFREGISKGMKGDGATPVEVETALGSFDQLIGEDRATGLIQNVVDEHVLSPAVETIHEKFANQPLIRAALQNSVAHMYMEIGLYEPAMPLLEASLRTRRRNDHRDTLASISSMANLLEMMGKHDEAEPYYREALAGWRRVLGDNHPYTLSSINNMGFVLGSMGRNDEALPYLRDALEGRRRVLGDEHPDTLTSIQNMGIVLRSMGNYEESMPYMREALEGRRRVLGDDHRNTLVSINIMGMLLGSMGKYAEAEPYDREALAGWRRVLGDNHPKTLMSITGSGITLASMGKYAEAEPYYREALERSRRVLGNDHPKTLGRIYNMGVLLKRMGKSVKAEPYHREALNGRRRVLGDNHRDTLNSINSMGILFQSMGKYDDAMLYIRQALEGRRRVLGGDHRATLLSINNMGNLLWSMGKYDDALLYIREALDGRRRVLGNDNPATLYSISSMGWLLESMGKYEEALAYSRNALQSNRRILGNDHPATLNSIYNMGSQLMSIGQFEEALAYSREALERCRRVFGDNHPDTLWSAGIMGMVLHSMGKYEEALTYSREALDGYHRVLGDNHPDTLNSIGIMGNLLSSMGMHDDALPYCREALEGRRRVLGDDHPDTLTSIHNVGTLLLSMGKYGDALLYIREALDGRRRVLGDDHPKTLASINDMGRLMRELGRLKEAEALGSESVWRVRRILPEGHRDTGVFLEAYGRTLLQLERFADAEAVLMESHSILEAALHSDHEYTVKTIKSLIELYEVWHVAEPENGYGAKTAEWRAKLPQPVDEHAEAATP